MPVDRQDEPGVEGVPAVPEEEAGGEPQQQTESPRLEKKRRKVSLIGAIVVNAITLITLAIILLAVLLPGYRRSFTVARATKGAEEVVILVRTSEAMMRENSTDFIRAQDGLKNALQEEVGEGQVWAYVRDAYPDLAWVKDNLPERMQEWLQGLFPEPEVNQKNIPEKEKTNGEEQAEEDTGT